MAFILRKDRVGDSRAEWEAAFGAYARYLESVRGRLPLSAYEFAAAPWHFDFGDPRSPHDAWLENVTIREAARGEGRAVEIAVTLLGAYHDGRIELGYTGVRGYSLAAPSAAPGAEGRGHGDWLYDEIRLSEGGGVLHEVEWSLGGGWLIECEDVSYRWLPLR